ncbi:MAG: DNA topoisomerase III, partial [Firmicutes bacterium HGW-Firmicutes-12]
AGREEEIKKFKSRIYYGISAMADQMKLTWHDSKTNESRIFDLDKCDMLIKSLQGKTGKVTKVEKIHKKINSPNLYDLTELQREANKRFDYSAKETLSIMQKLYEQHKLVTYPRTDSRYLSTDMVDTLKDRVKACNVQPYTNAANKILRSPIKTDKSFVDNSKVSDHHAIIPTEQKPSLGALTDKERKIYDLIVRRFLAILYPPFEYEETTITAMIDAELFKTKGKRVIASGWKEVYGSTDEEEEQGDNLANQTLPAVNKGDIIKVLSLSQTKGETKPPEYFTEGTLLSAMENPTKYMAGEDEKLIRTIGKTGGLGTVATRADVIEKLFNTFLLEKKGKNIYITSKGKQLLQLVPDDLKSPALTAEWELKLESIAKGELNKSTFINEMKNYAKAVVNEIKNVAVQYRHENITGNKCLVCGKNMLEVNGKKGKMLVCQDRECGYRKGLSKTTNSRCPNCHKTLSLYGEGESQIFICKCGYREKMSSFHKRKENDRANVSKRDVAKYLDKQQSGKEDLRNPALALALAKLKLKNSE